MANVLERLGYPPIEYADAPVPQAWVGGRSVRDGYQRGNGLEYGKLREQVDHHPLFREAFEAAILGLTVMAPDRLRNLFLLIVNHFENLESQNVIEFGCYRGGSLFFLAILLKRLYPNAKLYGLDTFSGMPKSDRSIDLHSEGDFSDTSLGKIQDHAASIELHNLTLIQGLVEETFPALIPADEKFGIAHIDLDIYRPIKYVQGAVWPRVVRGGYIVYDDATASSCIGATQAVEELIIERRAHSEQIYPHFVFRVAESNE